ncbi:MAG: NAD-dependent epimerase/dehydratase family protein [Ruminococcaceae bacterium]|nr:NAD-dependent epimerase/dehydratase family protein [Oscillospiraceae bacterium]
MKRILITGANSYIGTSFENYIKRFDGYSVDTVDMTDDSWREYEFSEYDTVLHVAGIAHIKETDSNKHLYYAVNRDLAIETAQKAKLSGVKQFVLLSSMSVYGTTSGAITKGTVPLPKSNYGKSKLEADNSIFDMCDESFKVAILRPPMVYGKGSKGNYSTLEKFAKKTPVFPKYNNKRSMIYIETLCCFIRLVIENGEKGFFHPQNAAYVNTSDMVYQIAAINKKKIVFTKLFNPFIRILRKHRTIEKVFGDLYYEYDMSAYKEEYDIIPFKKTIEKTNG